MRNSKVKKEFRRRKKQKTVLAKQEKLKIKREL